MVAFYEGDRLQRSHVSPDVHAEDEDGKMGDQPEQDHPEVLRVQAHHEPMESDFVYRATALTTPSSKKWRGVRLGSFMCGCMGANTVLDGTDSISAKSNSIKTMSPTESSMSPTESSAASDSGIPYDSSYPNSEHDLFESNIVVGPKLTSARLQGLPSTGFDEGCVPVVSAQTEQGHMYQPTLLSHRSLQVRCWLCGKYVAGVCVCTFCCWWRVHTFCLLMVVVCE